MVRERPAKPRIPPLEPYEWDAATREAMAPLVERGLLQNIFRTLANHPRLMERWMIFANYVFGESTLDPIHRELVIMRTGHLCQSLYEWASHVPFARALGMSDEAILSTKSGENSPGLTDLERLLFRATDELHHDAHISDETWSQLAGRLTTQQLMDLVFTIGQYRLVSMALNSFGAQPDPELPGWNLESRSAGAG